ncbi:MAG: glycosyltransferase family 2 protein [Planctomycetes bacterium]|nr:glycosyltransferase family 2 protein [Planctomycetota bacterium]
MEAISVIIPTLNEAGHVAGALRSVRRCRGVEAIVVDGGSTDGTADIAAVNGARVITRNACRATQLNAGADAANGEMFVFLHADTRLPRGYDRHVRRILSQPGTAAGAFEFRLDAHSIGLRLVELGVNFRSRCLRLPYGDQAIHVRRDVFRSVGGFPDMPIMEDFELVRRLHRRGRVVIAPVSVVTSARSWERLGVWMVTLLHQVSIGAYHAGFDPSRIARWHARLKGNRL